MDQVLLINFFDSKLKEKDFSPIAKLLTRFPENHVFKTVCLVAKNRWTDCSGIFTRYVKHFRLVPDVLIKKKNALLTIFCKKYLIQFLRYCKKINFFPRNQKLQRQVNAVTKLICYYFFVVGSLPESVSETPFTFAPSADWNSRTYIF